jgi:hypothetical protein
VTIDLRDNEGAVVELEERPYFLAIAAVNRISTEFLNMRLRRTGHEKTNITPPFTRRSCPQEP